MLIFYVLHDTLGKMAKISGGRKVKVCYFMAKGSISLNLLEAGGFQGPSFE